MGLTKREMIRHMRDAQMKEDRQPCAVCHTHTLITHRHHHISISKIYDLAIERGVPPEMAPQFTVWLCPNHHAMLHIMIDRPGDKLINVWEAHLEQVCPNDYEGLCALREFNNEAYERTVAILNQFAAQFQ